MGRSKTSVGQFLAGLLADHVLGVPVRASSYRAPPVRDLSECCRCDTTGKSSGVFPDTPSQPFRTKISFFPKTRKCALSRAVPRSQEGRFAIVTDVERGMRWTLWRGRRMRRKRTVKPYGPVPPTLGTSAWMISRATGANKPGTPGRVRSSRSNHRAGNAGVIRRTCGDYTRVLSTLHTRPRVRSRTRHSLRPPFGRDEDIARPGRKSRRGTAKVCLQSPSSFRGAPLGASPE